MSNTIRLDADLRAPDFTKIKPPIAAQDHRIDCRDFESVPALEKEIRRRFSEHGAVLLTDTGLDDPAGLHRWGNIVIEEPMPYEGGAGPRPQLAKGIYDVVADEPHHAYIYPHNEMSYLSKFPRCIVFGCETIPARGGETFLFDNRGVTHEILQSEIGRRLEKDGVRYVRNLTDAERSGDVVYKHWQDAFAVSTREEMEQIAKREDWRLEWRENGRVRLSYWQEAYEYNQTLEENLFFVNLSLLGAYFDDWHPFDTLPYEDRPFDVVHGNGEPFTERETEYLVHVFDNHCLPIFWKPGWIAMLDNERWAHARPPFTLQEGETRKLGAMMGNPKNRIGARFGME
uniref:Taurine catabolism dioxygenase TauD, TfdA family n=1 Tax=Candidatus Kentrum sp. FM TaxID=2126340 RepID=A0A450WIB3_9GAMM|nr:MAG: Taurine catabolism dioxygenase TauD, TfdA family [Candidatus Kentron sp. FM]VFJ67794.1 MAG: Taurine catabolism dioxygenase TauD, TfdA family [Candidatus Kentron sp. FM]VFK16769.1 MAG: Taurine catabolism dioxygenase TauD, TfdA family [Candidatus Kentron sp. FM]